MFHRCYNGDQSSGKGFRKATYSDDDKKRTIADRDHQPKNKEDVYW